MTDKKAIFLDSMVLFLVSTEIIIGLSKYQLQQIEKYHWKVPQYKE